MQIANFFKIDELLIVYQSLAFYWMIN